MKYFNLKSLALFVLFLGLNQILAENKTPSIGKRLTSMVEHSFYAAATGVPASVIGWVGLAALATQNGTIGTINSGDVSDPFQRFFTSLVVTIAKSPYGPHMVLGASGVIGAIALYNTYKVGSNFFGMIKDRV